MRIDSNIVTLVGLGIRTRTPSDANTNPPRLQGIWRGQGVAVVRRRYVAAMDALTNEAPFIVGYNFGRLAAVHNRVVHNRGAKRGSAVAIREAYRVADQVVAI